MHPAYCTFQTIHDSGTYDELCQRQSITAESIFGDDYIDASENSDEVESPSDGHNSNPESEHNSSRPKKLTKRQQSVMQYMRDQQSIDDDPVAVLSVSHTKMPLLFLFLLSSFKPFKLFFSSILSSCSLTQIMEKPVVFGEPLPSLQHAPPA